MKDTAEVVKAALDESERAQSVAMDAIQLAQNNTKGTLDLLVTVSLTYEEKHHRSQINKIFTQFHTWKKKSYKNRNYSVSEKKKLKKNISFTH